MVHRSYHHEVGLAVARFDGIVSDAVFVQNFADFRDETFARKLKKVVIDLRGCERIDLSPIAIDAAVSIEDCSSFKDADKYFLIESGRELLWADVLRKWRDRNPAVDVQVRSSECGLLGGDDDDPSPCASAGFLQFAVA